MPGLQRVTIIGATGATGIHLARELRRRGIAVRVSSRSRAKLERAFSDLDVEIVPADATDEAAVRATLDGCDAVVDCIGLPSDQMHLHPVTAGTIADAARTAGTRTVHVSSFWSFLPVRRLPLDEEHPRQGGNRTISARREAEDVMLAAGAAVIHLPDFFGPHVAASSHQGPLEDAAAGRAMNWIGAADVVREAVYVPDAMRHVAELMDRDEGYGRSWIVPGSGPVTANGLAEIAGRHLGRRVKVRTAPPMMLRVLSLFSKDLRAFMPMVPHYVGEMRYDGSRLRSLLEDVPATPYEEAVPETLDWLRDR